MGARGDAGYEAVIALRAVRQFRPTMGPSQSDEKGRTNICDWPGAAVSIGSVVDDDDEMQVQTRSSPAPQPELSEYRTSY